MLSTSYRFHILAALVAGALVSHITHAGEIGATALTPFSDGKPAIAAEVNGNFNTIKDAVNVNNTRLGTVETNSATQATNINSINTATGSNTSRIGALETTVDGATGLSTRVTGLNASVAKLNYGRTVASPGLSCADVRDNGLARSGVTWVIVPGTATPVEIYCDQTTNGGGWAMLYNSVLGTNTLQFWNILYADRLTRRGRADVGSNFYDGSVYDVFNVVRGSQLMDVIEDIRGKAAVGVVARITNFDPTTMRLTGTLVSGDSNIFINQVNGGWSAPDYDGDSATANCSTSYGNVSQHYGACFSYSLGADGDAPVEDGTEGPHVVGSTLTALGLRFAADGGHNRVRRISRFVRW